jgi:hypothetical protein
MSRKSPARKGKPNKGRARAFSRLLEGKVERAIVINKRKRVKPPYLTPYLLDAVGKVVTLPAITVAQARDKGAPVIVIDARKIVRTVKPTLWMRPDNTVRARLITLAALDKRVAQVSYLRFLANNHPNVAEGHEDAYKVILFRVK